MKWDEIDQQVCSVARALSVVGERWTLLIIRDAFRGTRRFDDFQRNLGVTRHRLAERLHRLVEDGVLTKVPYNQKPLRHEYRLTRKGLALYPILQSLSHWGDQWCDDGAGPPLHYWHARCGKRADPVISCSECGDPLKPEELSTRQGEVLSAYTRSLRETGETIPADAALPLAAAEFNAHYKNTSEETNS